ncbi:MAG: tRNA (adenosine(37)-N6)-threonylcarbamoyltransferase complex dimerization subunit type 1 TsaB [Ignavibacteria bacterium]|nr:tRNA (adenosine(37)-N6)-threonylcarbamoyltransferase complex dimerization subunit type 1 TsaB [Ignavibacteria bacterium]
MKLLSISSASDILSLAIVEDDKILNSFSSEGNRRHAELISIKIKELMESLKLKFSELDGVCVNLGPGSFTGLRVGLATAKGIVFGAKVNLYGYTNFEELLYRGINEKNINGKVAVVIHSRQNEFYFGAFQVLEKKFTQLDVFELMKLDELKIHSHNFDFIISEKKYAQLLMNEINNVEIVPLENDAYFGALIVQQNPQKYLCENYDYLEPLYLKNFDVKLKK